MYLKPEEAEERWCPFARVPFGNNSALTSMNRGTDSHGLSGETKCIATGCMAWRWAKADPEELGYCGLAGVPSAEAVIRPKRRQLNDDEMRASAGCWGDDD